MERIELPKFEREAQFSKEGAPEQKYSCRCGRYTNPGYYTPPNYHICSWCGGRVLPVIHDDMYVVVKALCKHSREEAIEAALCLLKLLMPFTVGNAELTEMLIRLRDRIFY